MQVEGVKAMELFGRELSLEQMVGLVECHATPDEDLVHRAALEIIAALRESQRGERAAVDTLTKLLKHANDYDDICAVCKNRIECKGENCECFEQGKGMSWGKVEYPDMKWTCEDFNYGTCKKMENTPCQGCFDSEYSGFDWVGLEVKHD